MHNYKHKVLFLIHATLIINILFIKTKKNFPNFYKIGYNMLLLLYYNYLYIVSLVYNRLLWH